MAVVITLVHGTWGYQSEWIREHSALRAAFQKAFKEMVFFRTFYWSGRNSFAARETAAEDLKTFLREGIEIFPYANHAIIAHSHGGNIALKALDEDVIRSRVSTVICLSTPFLTVASRNFGPFLSFALKFGHLAVAGAAAIFLNVEISPLRAFAADAFRPDSHFLYFCFVLTFAAEVLLFWSLIYFPAKRWRAYAEKFTKSQTIRPVSDLHVLVIRPPADEASGVLTTTQFLAWFATRAWQAAAFIPSVFRSAEKKWTAWTERHKVWSFLVACGIMAASFWGTRENPLSDMRRKWLEGPIVLFFTALVLRVFYVRMIIFLLLVLSTFAVGLFILPLIAILSLAVVPFSPSDAFLVGPLQIAAEAAPIGRCEILQLPSTGAEGLMHSSTYTNPLALDASVAWVLVAQDTPSLSPQQVEEWNRSKATAMELSAPVIEELSRRLRRARAWSFVRAAVLALLLILAGWYLWRCR